MFTNFLCGNYIKYGYGECFSRNQNMRKWLKKEYDPYGLTCISV